MIILTLTREATGVANEAFFYAEVKGFEIAVRTGVNAGILKQNLWGVAGVTIGGCKITFFAGRGARTAKFF